MTEDRVNDLLAENENSFMIGYNQAYGIYGSYLLQNDFLFTLPFYYDSDSGPEIPETRVVFAVHFLL